RGVGARGPGGSGRARVRNAVHAGDDAPREPVGGARAGLRLHVRADQPRVGSGSGTRGSCRRRDRERDRRRGAVRRARGDLRRHLERSAPHVSLRRVRAVLVANRGEIALRVFRAARARGLEAIAVAERDDRGSLHARSADRVVEISSYLDPAEHLRAAAATGADAVHPGYGFLAENADFAAAVDAAGLRWIGPPASALRAGGDKMAAKRIARDAGVPTVPDAEQPPLIVKAAAGGGGRGMRIVRDSAELDEAVAAARREALAAFGDDRAYLERYLER